ncbi:MAG: hypothetical protein NVSMB56_11260 [Pyrinomonadaceae bacterium]
MRHPVRNLLLTLGYIHPAALVVAAKRGRLATKQYLAEIYRCSKTDAGLHLPTVRLEELIDNAAEFTVYRPASWDGSMTITEIGSLCHLIAARRPCKILEIGSFQGLTTLNMAINAPQAEVHTLDLPPSFDPEKTQFSNNDTSIITRRGFLHYNDRPEAERIHPHFGDTATFDYSEIGGGVDFALVDAAHAYDYVRNDTVKALPLLTDNGIMLWHDYGRNDFMAAPEDAWGVSRFLHEIADTGVKILQGTSLGILLMQNGVRQKLMQRLGMKL